MRAMLDWIVRRLRSLWLAIKDLFQPTTHGHSQISVRVSHDGLAEAALRPGSLSPHLVGPGHFSESDDYLRAMFEQFQLNEERVALMKKALELGMGYVDLPRVRIDDEALATLPAEFARQETVLPLKRVGNTLWLAMKDPCCLGTIDRATDASGCRVIPVLAMPSELEEAIRTYYPSSDSAYL